MSDDQVLNTSFTAEIGDVLTKLSNMIKGVLELAGTSTVLASAMGQADASLKSVTESLKKAETAADQLDRTLAQVGLGAKGAGTSLKEATTGITEVAAETEKGTKRSQEYKDALASLKSTYGDNAAAMKGLKSELGKVDDAFQQAMVKGDANSQSMQRIYQHTELVARAVNNYAGKANLSIIPLQKLAEGNTALGSKMSDTEFKATALGKAFMATSTKSKEFFDALVLGGERFGANTDKTNSYVKSLIDVDKHLQSIPASSVNAKAAQSELADSMTLSQRAIELMGGSIVKVKDGFEGIGSNVKASGTVMNQYGQTLVNLNKEHANLATGFKQYTEAHKTNSAAVSQAQDRLSKYIGIVDQVKAKYKDTNAALVQAGDGFRIYGDKVNDSAKVAKQMQYDTGLLTQTFYDQAQVQKVLRGEQELSVQALEKVAVTSNANRKGIQELAKDYTGLTKGLQDVGQYGQVYVDSLKATTAANFTEKASVEQAIASHLKYAKTAEGLISQSQVMTDVTIKKIKASSDYANNLEGQNAAISKAKSSHESLANALRSTQSIEAGLSREGGTLRDSMLNVANSMGVNVTQTDALRSAASQLLPMQEKYRTVIEGLNEQIKSGGLANETAKRQLDSHVQSVKAGEAAVQRATKANEDHNKSLKETPTLLGKIGSTIGNYAVFTVASATISAFVGTITGAVSTIVQFDQILHSLKAITGATTIEMAGMGDTIKEVSASSRYGVDAIGEGLQIMGQAGLSAEDSMKAIGSATTLATGTLEKMENVVDLLTSTMSAYGMSAGESTRITDILATAVNRSKLTVDKLRTSLNYVGVIAAQSGLSLEQTTASLMVLADRGMKASTIGTGLRQVLDKLIAPNEKLREAYKAHGIELSKISPLSVGYEEALRNLTKTLYDSKTGMVDTSKAFELFGIRGAQAATILIQSFASGEWKDTVDSFDEVGSASKMAAEQMLGLSALWENLVAKVKVLAVSLGEGGLSTVIRGVVQVLSGLADALIGLIKIDWGFFGYLVSTFVGLTAVVGASLAAMTAYNFVMVSVATTGTFLNGVFNSLTASVLQLNVALATNVFGLVLLGVTATIVSFQTYLSYLDSVSESHHKAAASASTMASSIGIFQSVVEKADGDTRKLAVAVNRLKSEQPELAKEIAKVAGVSDVASLSFVELTKAMESVRQQKLDEAIRENISALNSLLEKEAMWAEINFFVGDAYKTLVGWSQIAIDKIVELKDVYDKWAASIFGSAPQISTLSEQAKQDVKALADTYVKAGVDIKKTLAEQKEASMAKLEADKKAGLIQKVIYDQLVLDIAAAYQKIELRMQASKVNYAKYTNDVGQFYKNLSIKQREEVQNMVYEEEKAVEKFEKFAADKNLSSEEKEAELYAIHLKYRMKTLTVLNEFSKKEYETVDEKYNREQALIDQNFVLLKEDEAKQVALYESLAAKGEKLNAAQLSAMRSHYMNLQTLKENYQNNVAKQENLAFERSKKLLNDLSSEIKASIGLRASLLEVFELEKIRLSQKGAEADLQIVNAEIENVKRVAEAKKIAGTFDESAQVAYNSKMKTLLAEEVKARTDAINKTLEEGKYWLERSNEMQDKKLEYTKNIITQEKDLAQTRYTDDLDAAQKALDKKIAIIDLEEINETVADKRKLDAKLKYWDATVKAAQENLEAQLSLTDQEYVKVDGVLKEKFGVQEKYYDAVKNLYNTEVGYAEKSQREVLDLVSKGTTDRLALASSETEATKTEYQKQTDALMGEITNRGNTVAEDLQKRGIALVKVTGMTKEQLRDQGLSWVKFGEETYKVIDKQTFEVQRNAKKQTEIVKQEYDTQTQIMLTEITKRGNTVQQDLERYGMALVKVTEAETAELDKRGISWKKYEDGIYKILFKETFEVKKAATDQAGYVRKSLEEQYKEQKIYLDKKIADYSKSLEDVKKVIDAETAAWIAQIKAVEKAKEGIRLIDDKYKDAIRKNRQSTMTEEQKYVDDLKAIEEAHNKAKETGLKEYSEKELSLITSLSDEYQKADGSIFKSKKEMEDKKDSLLKASHELALQLQKDEISKAEEGVKKLEESIKQHTEAMEMIKTKLVEFKEMKIELDNTKFLESINPIMIGIDAVIEKLRSVKGAAPIDIDVSAVQLRIQEATNLIDQLISKMTDTAIPKIEVSVSGKDGVVLPEYLNAQKQSLQDFSEKVNQEIKPVVAVDFQASGLGDKKPLDEGLTEIQTKVEAIPASLEMVKPTVITGFQIQLGDKVESFTEGLMSFASKMEPLKTPTNSEHTIKVNGLADLEKAIKYHADLKDMKTDSYHTVHVTTVKDGESGGESSTGSRTGGYIAARLGGLIQHLRNGGGFTGLLPGFGGGDIVNARLEPGEFVMRKEAVRKIGVNALRQWNNLNSSALKGINPQNTQNNTESLFSGQLHTINLNIGDRIHRVYGESNVLNSLTTSLRRSRLTTA